MKGPGVKPTQPWKGARPGEAASRQAPADELFTLVAFDVSDDKARRRVGELCKDYDLRRSQWSVFEGRMTRNRREELVDRLTLLLNECEGGGRVAVFPIGAREIAWSSRISTRGVPPRRASGDDDG